MSGGKGPLELVRTALAGHDAWLVGGTVRDRLLDRPGARLDLDLVVRGDPRCAAQAIRDTAPRGTAMFALSEAFGAWRVVGPGHSWQVDVAALRGQDLDDDLRARDFTLNAMAEPVGDPGALIDPTGGAADLAASRLRIVSATALDDDPLRVLRLARLAVELGLEPDVDALAAARAAAPGLAAVAAERVFSELRLIVGSGDPLRGLELLDATGAAGIVLPELVALRGVEQTRYHHLDAYGHTLEVLERVVDLERDPEGIVGSTRAAATAALLEEPLADELTRGGALRWGALLHDIAKPGTRTALEGGRVGFPQHDREGAAMARAILGRLRSSERLREHVAALARHHLRLGFLVHERPLGRRQVHRYLLACAPVEVDVTLLSLADRLATRGRHHEESIAHHLEVALPMLDDALAWRARGPQRPLVRGDELARALGIAPGPRLGELLAEIEEARFAGEVTTAEQAIDEARRLLRGGVEPG
ncbi:MAG: HD domain-containing protein [Solirubrobacteraceae bacterium]|nr:HD domain-containing protein [Solirubrobacteraceae bacterium]